MHMLHLNKPASAGVRHENTLVLGAVQAAIAGRLQHLGVLRAKAVSCKR